MPTPTPLVTRDLEADIACAVEELSFVEAVYVLDPRGQAEGHPDAFALAVILAPYDARHLVRAHYAILLATGNREVSGRVLYVNGAMPAPTPVRHARKLSVAPADRFAAHVRIAERQAASGQEDAAERRATSQRRADLEGAFQKLLEKAIEDRPPTSLPPGNPYRIDRPLSGIDEPVLQALVDRVFQGLAIAAPFRHAVLEVVADPFPASAKRVLVIDKDPESARVADELSEWVITHVTDGWTAIDQLTATGPGFALVICAVVLDDEFRGAKLYRLAVTARPELASRFVFLADESAIASAPPASVKGRVTARPLTAAAIRRLLES